MIRNIYIQGTLLVSIVQKYRHGNGCKTDFKANTDDIMVNEAYITVVTSSKNLYNMFTIR